MIKKNIQVVALLLCFANCTLTLAPCNGTVSKLQLCMLVSDYDKGSPPIFPMYLLTSITIFSISEVNQFENTISLNLLISAVWNDTRLTLESNYSNK